MGQKRVRTQDIGQYEDYDHGDYVEGGFKRIDDNFVDIYPLSNQTFSGVISLSKVLTHYSDYEMNSSLAITLGASPMVGGAAEIRLIGDGSHTPSFDAAFTKSAASSDYSTVLNAVNKVVFYYDGGSAFYSITVL